MFKNPFSFNGRIRRLEYGLSFVIYLAVIYSLEAILLDSVEENSNAAILYFIILIPLVWFMFAQGAKRCHDRGSTGWFQIIPFYGFWMLFADSEHGDNEYGPNPKGIGNVDEIDQIGEYLVDEARP